MCVSRFEPALARARTAGVLLVLAALAPAAGAPAAARAESPASAAALRESDNPISTQGSRFNYRSNVIRVTPALAGLQVRVVQYVDRLQLINHTGETVTVYGYQGEPYARVLADGVVEENTRSRAYYLNRSFFGLITVPAWASASAPPRWVVLDDSGQLEWHDHRIHWMLPGIPPQVTDRAKRTKIFDWTVPIAVNGRRGAVDGELVWVPEEDWAPLALFAALIAAALVGTTVALVLRRRARRGGGRDQGMSEAW